MPAATKTDGIQPCAYECVEAALRNLLECLQFSPNPEIRHSAQ
jgi:hypothetical protein